MLTISTERGTVQYHRHEQIFIRSPGEKGEWGKVNDWLLEGAAIGFKFGPGDEIKLPKLGWTPILAVSWNAAWDRQNEAERAQRKADRLKREAEEAAVEAERLRTIAAEMSAML